MNLLNRWPLFLEAIGTRDSSGEVFADLDRHYRDPGRFYHLWEHVADCLAALDTAPGLCDRPEAVELALWFHDAVYDPRAGDNEARSTSLLREAAGRLGLAADLENRAAGLVMTTAHLGDVIPSDRDAGAIRDIDLAILGAAPARFDAYEAAVRREYGFLSDSEWRAGRSRVLHAFLDRPRIYLTGDFHDRLEQQARSNLEDSVRRLA